MAMTTQQYIEALLRGQTASAAEPVSPWSVMAQPEPTQIPPSTVAEINQPPTQEAVARAAGIAPPPVDDAAERQMLAQLAQQQKMIEQIQRGSIEDQRQGLLSQKQAIADMVSATPVQTDYSALMGLVDTFSRGKSKMSESYKKPKDYAETMKTVASLENELQQRRKDLSNSEIAMLQNKLASRMMEGSGRQARFEKAEERKMEDTIRSDIYKNVLDPAAKLEQAAGVVEAALASGVGARVTQALANFAKIQGETGVLTDQDINRQLQETFGMKFDKWISQMTNDPESYRIPEQYLNLLRGNLADARKVTAGVLANKIADREVMYSSGAYAPLMGQGRTGGVMLGQARKSIEKLTAPSAMADKAKRDAKINAALDALNRTKK